MSHTKFHHLSNDELVRLVESSECTQLEVELAQRLSEAEDEIAEVLDSTRCACGCEG